MPMPMAHVTEHEDMAVVAIQLACRRFVLHWELRHLPRLGLPAGAQAGAPLVGLELHFQFRLGTYYLAPPGVTGSTPDDCRATGFYDKMVHAALDTQG